MSVLTRFRKKTEVSEVEKVTEQVMKEPEVSGTECKKELTSQRNMRTVIANALICPVWPPVR